LKAIVRFAPFFTKYFYTDNDNEWGSLFSGQFAVNMGSLTITILAKRTSLSNHTDPQNGPGTTRKKPFLSPLLMLAVGVLAASFSAILIRWAQAEAPSLVIAAGRTGLATGLLLPIALLRRRPELKTLSPVSWRWAILAGLMLALHFAGWISSLEYTSVTSSTVLFATAPFWVALAAPWLLSEPLTRPVLAGIGLALLGTTIIALDSNAGGDQSLLGNGLALLGAITYAAYFIIGRRLRLSLSLLSYTTLVYGSAALFLLFFTWAAGYSLAGYSAGTYLLIILLALFPQLLGHSSYNYALGYLPAVYVSIASIAEPIGATILAFLLLQELPGWLTLAGSVFVLAGVLVAGRKP
jgi:drug/metabolite transporter (DMT)-like permease